MQVTQLLTPKETHYKGYRFRSRLEARWAVFFDALGIKWEYEKEGFHLPSGPYLPDFWLPLPTRQYPEGGYWLEVKGIQPNDIEVQKAWELCQSTKHTTWLTYGLPGANYWHVFHHRSGHVGKGEKDEGKDLETENWWGREVYTSICLFAFEYIEPWRIRSAIAAAKSARFEYGEHGAR